MEVKPNIKPSGPSKPYFLNFCPRIVASASPLPRVAASSLPFPRAASSSSPLPRAASSVGLHRPLALSPPPVSATTVGADTRIAVSVRSNVYCLSVVLLALIMGRFPSQYLLNACGGTDVVEWAASTVANGGEQELVDPVVAADTGVVVVRLLRVGVQCTIPKPESRQSPLPAYCEFEI
ncbi:hypothetical protein GUJ93_ZPchr0009g706 [Zizania palustris]|uniref:Uncharacterized protein n=1 Tax=Zizania palustris TaxID=103762 RepID=A0A8J5R402_ZIZPA|nr:hypothetical protein GUJ93_ZPchr0009g706 [Zizania palustris]